MQREALLLSVRPVFVGRILEGSKTAELRRVRPMVRPGQDVLIYSSSPTRALLASAVVERVDVDLPKSLWQRVHGAAGVSIEEYSTYFAGAERAAAIWLTHVEPFDRPIKLQELRNRWPWFRPPQSYCFVRATFERADRRVTSLAPRAV
jgi:predicted transcriptional regulator